MDLGTPIRRRSSADVGPGPPNGRWPKGIQYVSIAGSAFRRNLYRCERGER